jgi:hypothetical protein
MEVLLERTVRGDVVAAVCRRNGELVVTAGLREPSPSFAPLIDLTQVVWTEPVVVAGQLPEHVVGVRVLWPGDWADVVVSDGAWLGVAADEPVSEQPIWALAFTCADGSVEPVPDPGEAAAERAAAGAEADWELPEIGAPSDEALVYAATLADAIAADIEHNAPPGPVRRLVVRWFWEGDPLHLTIHVLAAGDRQPDAEDAWYPLEWGLDEREFARTDRVLARPDVRAAATALTTTFRKTHDGGIDGMAHLPAVIELVRRLPDALAAHGVAVTERFAAAAAHFEGWGARAALDATASAELRAALEAHGELPID